MKSLLVFVLCLVLFSSISSIFQKNLKSLNEKSEKKDGEVTNNSSTTTSPDQVQPAQSNCQTAQTNQQKNDCLCNTDSTATNHRTENCYTQNSDLTYAFHSTYTARTTTTVPKKQSNKESSVPKVARISTTSN